MEHAVGELRESDTVLDFLMGQPNVMPRLNERVLSGAGAKFLDLSGRRADADADVEPLTPRDLMATWSAGAAYWSSAKAGQSMTPITVWLVADVATPQGRRLVRGVLEHSRSSALMRVALLDSGAADAADASDARRRYADAVAAADVKLADRLLRDDAAQALLAGAKTAADFGLAAAAAAADAQRRRRRLDALVLRRVLDLQPGQRALVVNGRVIGKKTKLNEKLSLNFNFNLSKNAATRVLFFPCHTDFLFSYLVSSFHLSLLPPTSSSWMIDPWFFQLDLM